MPAPLKWPESLVLTLIPIESAFGGLIIFALLFPAQTIPQIIGIIIGWPIGFWVQGRVRKAISARSPEPERESG